MKKNLFISLLLLLMPLSGMAERVTLRSGKVVDGQILVQTDEVLIIRDSSGARHQYPISDVLSIVGEAQRGSQDNEAESAGSLRMDDGASSGKKAMLLLELSGGGMAVEHGRMGAFASADLVIGSRRLLGRSLLLGGSVGYMGAFAEGKTYSFLPINLVIRMPVLEGRHSPLLGASFGYGVGLNKNYTGGLCAGVDAGYRYIINDRAQLMLSATARFQQATMTVQESIAREGEAPVYYTNRAGRNLVAFGLKLGFSF